MESWRIDATKFQTQLGELATTVAYKVQREGVQLIGSRTATEDIYCIGTFGAACIRSFLLLERGGKSKTAFLARLLYLCCASRRTLDD